MTSIIRTRRMATVVAGASIFALTLSACSSDGTEKTPEASKGADGNITLTVATFNQFGYTPELLKEYEDANPGIKVEQTVAALSGDARTNLTTRLAAGGDGLADVEAIEVDWMPELSEIADSFEDLAGPDVTGRYVPWKEAQGTADGKLIGLGTDIGPEAICYRADLFEAAGLPSDREGVAELLGGKDATWEKYFEVGHQFVANSDSAWFDSAVAIMQSQIGQLPAAYENASTGEPTDLASNTVIKGMYDTILTESVDLSARLGMWGDDWAAGFQSNAFATMPCPPWMTSVISGNADGVDGWNVADVFPGGGGNWGGSFLTVPSTGKNTAEAAKLATWLTAPEQQAKAFASAGTFPSQIEAQALPQVKDATNEFFADAPVGQIFSNRANQISATPPFKGLNYFAIQQIVMDALNRVDIDGGKADDSWNLALTNFGELGF
ncbi:cellobiose-binding protein [Sanguibacter gelidistatuariae]|uniref:Cellobiose-binding protein n=1 Tax=Sanguibacter gelidistatuariae TaxID=1814289 RepID=A0A1G6QKT6_9MICO|nr:extracellular solute-binding protein [Sanguibacter gelidistatuariae]SDC93050.1 cellobiose-binding protein [Sanguibacter gelidistatuariae]